MTCGYGLATDGVYSNGSLSPTGNSGIDLTTVWSFNAAYDHRWSPALKTSIYGGYLGWSYNADANAQICAINAISGASVAAGLCNNNWKQWFIGSRTQWDVARGFYMGVDVLYNKLQSASSGSQAVFGFNPGAPRIAGTYNIADQSAWVFTFRVHRDIVP